MHKHGRSKVERRAGVCGFTITLLLMEQLSNDAEEWRMEWNDVEELWWNWKWCYC